MFPESFLPPLSQSKSLLGPPTSIEDLDARVSVFWGIYYGDRSAALMTGFPTAFDERTENPDMAITTVFPKRSGHFGVSLLRCFPFALPLNESFCAIRTYGTQKIFVLSTTSWASRKYLQHLQRISDILALLKLSSVLPPRQRHYCFMGCVFLTSLVSHSFCLY